MAKQNLGLIFVALFAVLAALYLGGMLSIADFALTATACPMQSFGFSFHPDNNDVASSPFCKAHPLQDKCFLGLCTITGTNGTFHAIVKTFNVQTGETIYDGKKTFQVNCDYPPSQVELSMPANVMQGEIKFPSAGVYQTIVRIYQADDGKLENAVWQNSSVLDVITKVGSPDVCPSIPTCSGGVSCDGVPSCPSGKVWSSSANACVSLSPNVCTAAWHYDTSLMKCVPDNPATGCGQGMIWDTVGLQCVSTQPVIIDTCKQFGIGCPACPTGYHWVSSANGCQPMQCPSGKIFDTTSGTCISTANQTLYVCADGKVVSLASQCSTTPKGNTTTVPPTVPPNTSGSGIDLTVLGIIVIAAVGVGLIASDLLKKKKR